MAQKSKITWTGYTWNPIIGCSKISAGCKYCYAEVMADRINAMTNGNSPYMEVLVYPTDDYGYIDDVSKGWRGNTVLVEKQLTQPKFGKPKLVFVGSMTDLFHKETPDEWLDKIFKVIKEYPKHTFQILTKRPERMVEYFTSHNIPDNVWLGVTVENQAMAEKRIPQLLQLNPTVAFISAEPLLGSIDLSRIINANLLDWVIVGGESGNEARPAHHKWVESILLFCNANKIPFFFKQWGKWMPVTQIIPPNEPSAKKWVKFYSDKSQEDYDFFARVHQKTKNELLNFVKQQKFPNNDYGL